ncbi:hypothetical protein BG000_008788 [Podila horticola]|nr:hypothetical protein BG000_008788 [Podila horticola]
MTSSQTTKSTFTTRTNPALAAAAAATSSNSKYRILYLKLHGMAATARAILAISGVEWETDWATEKKQVPMGVMPVLYEVHQGSGLTLEIPESEAIERYLARKFSLLGQDLWEETAINVFYSSSNAVMANYVNKVLLAFPDTKVRELEKFVAKEVPAWIVQHEKWLGKNGLNGHYVGDQLSIADIRSVICLDRTLEQNERYWAWIHSDEFEAINVSTRQRLAVLSG